MPSWTRLDLAKLRELYESGLSMPRVARAMNCTTSTVRYHLLGLGVAIRPPKRIDWPIEQMRHWYEVELLSLQDIADRLGQKQKAVNKVAKRHGFAMKPRGSGGYRGERSMAYKNGRTVDKSGYVLVLMPDHPHANNAGYVREHRLIAEQMLGRPLLAMEVVHHKNDIRSDNRPENLHVFASNGEHLAATLAGKCPQWSEEGRQRILAATRKPRAKKRTQPESAPDGQVSP